MAYDKYSVVEKLREAMWHARPSQTPAEKPSPSVAQQLAWAQQLQQYAANQVNGWGGLGGAAGLANALGTGWPLQALSAQSSDRQQEEQQRTVSTLAARIAQLRDVPAVKITSRVPDLVGTITAWRGWKITGGKLCALGMTGVWEPKKAVKARCSKGPTSSHDAPTKDCECGYWSFRTMDLLQSALNPYAASVQVIGSVEVWGKVIECENGFRSEFAYPKELWLLEDGLEHLSWVYGVPVRRLEV